MNDTQGMILFAFMTCVCPITITWIGWFIFEKLEARKHKQENNLDILNVMG